MSLYLESVDSKKHKFARRSILPLKQDYFWRIESGIIRSLTWLEDGTIVTIGLWGSGDIAGKVLSKGEPYQVECITPVEATILPMNRYIEVNQALIVHIQRSQEFLEIIQSRSVEASIFRLLNWLASKFGRGTEQGKLIDFRLTHQEIADIIGATRVTVTRILNEFEGRGIIQRLPQQFIVLNEQNSFWHYEI